MRSDMSKITTPLGPTQVRVGIINEATGKVAAWHEISRQSGIGTIDLRESALGDFVTFVEGVKYERDADGNEVQVENHHIVSADLVRVRTWDTNYYGDRINRRTVSARQYITAINEKEA